MTNIFCNIYNVLTHFMLITDVNTIAWNSNGQYILSGSDDLHLSITDAFTGDIKTNIRTGHTNNIFSAKFLPNTDDTKIVSCSGDGVIIHTDLNRPDTTLKNIFKCHKESVYDIVTVPNDPNSFLTCSHDCTVRWYDLRVKQSCNKHSTISHRKCDDDVLITCERPVTAIAVNDMIPWQMAIGSSDSIVRIYDRRMLSTQSLGANFLNPIAYRNASILAKFTYDGLKNSNRITSLAYSRDCQQILASYSNDNLYLFNLNEVRRTINSGDDDDLYVEKPERSHSSYKRFRLRGDWSDTGPSAMTNEELRNINNSDPNNTSNESTRSADNPNVNNNDNLRSNRMRELNTLLAALFADALNDDQIDNQVIMRRRVDNPNPSNDNETTPRSNENSDHSYNSNQNLDSVSNPSVDANDSRSETSSEDSVGLLIHIIDDEPYRRPRANRNLYDVEERMEEDRNEESDSNNENLNDPITSPNSTMTQSNRRRTQSYSSDNDHEDSRNKMKALRNNFDKSPQHHSAKFGEINDIDLAIKKRMQTYKIKNVRKFVGHRNSRTVIKKAKFWGDNYIVSGSDCGHIFFWSIETGEVVLILEGDQHVVNCLEPHSTDPIMASSGIDYDIKIWTPDAQTNQFDLEKANKIMNRNRLLLSESRDTVTVPARFVLNLFSSYQRNRNLQQDRSSDSRAPENRSANNQNDDYYYEYYMNRNNDSG
ncbi:hypothetical protein SSS_06033 [Sarcoptes scabiei]|nr:hypothetical protein SSS_06033 [Sarcoptes scabiei]